MGRKMSLELLSNIVYQNTKLCLSVLYIYYSLAYIKRNGDVSLANYKFELCTEQFTRPSVWAVCYISS